MAKTFITEIQKRFSDVDFFGHINNLNIQAYFDVGKTRFYSSVLKDTMDWHKNSLVIVSVHSDYMFQTKYEDEIYIETAIEKIGNRSFTFIQKLVDAKRKRINAVSRTVIVGFDFEKQISIPLLPVWRECFEEYLVDSEEQK